MKKVHIVKFISIICLTLSITNLSFAQFECKFSKDDCAIADFPGWEEFDFRSQSAYALLSPGDIQKINFVVYRGKDYIIYTCAEFDLGEVQFQVLKPVKKTERLVDRIEEREDVQYELDEYGEVARPESNNWEPVVLSKKTVYDTVWKVNRYEEEQLVFDSQTNETGRKFWYLKNAKETERLRIKVVVPEGDPEFEGCCSILIGYRHTSSKQFLR